jgi:hypothetical protein
VSADIDETLQSEVFRLTNMACLLISLRQSRASGKADEEKDAATFSLITAPRSRICGNEDG